MTAMEELVMSCSSFSWWGAWLDNGKDKLVIAPEKWMNGRGCCDIYTDEMIRV